MEIKYSKKSIVLPNGTKRNYYYKTENKNKVRVSADVYKAFMKKKKGGAEVTTPAGTIRCDRFNYNAPPDDKIVSQFKIINNLGTNINAKNVYNQCKEATRLEQEEATRREQEAIQWCKSANPYYNSRDSSIFEDYDELENILNNNAKESEEYKKADSKITELEKNIKFYRDTCLNENDEEKYKGGNKKKTPSKPAKKTPSKPEKKTPAKKK